MTTQQKIIKNKLGLLDLANMLGNVSQACKVMGYSNDSFYRFRDLYERGGEWSSPKIMENGKRVDVEACFSSFK